MSQPTAARAAVMNDVARLAGVSHQTVSRVLGVVSFDTILYGPAATLLGVERPARRADYGISIVALEQLDRRGVADAVNRLAEQSVAGVVIIAPLLTAATAAHSLPTGIPAVVVESEAAGDLTTISVDQVAG